MTNYTPAMADHIQELLERKQQEIDRLNIELVAAKQHLQALTGETFSERMHAALKSRAHKAEADLAAIQAENKRLRKAIVDFAAGNSWAAQAWKDQPYIKPLFDIAGEAKP